MVMMMMMMVLMEMIMMVTNDHLLACGCHPQESSLAAACPMPVLLPHDVR